MDTLGREANPRAFNPLLAAKVLAWFGAAVLVLGTVGAIYLVTVTGQDSQTGSSFAYLFGRNAQGRVYGLMTMLPTVFSTTAWIWAVAAFLWWRGNADT